MGSVPGEDVSNSPGGGRKSLIALEQDLRNSFSLALIEQALPDALFVHDHLGRFIEVNRKACESLGYSRVELLAMCVTDIEQDFDLAGAQEVWSRITPGGTTVIWGRQRRKDGSIFPVEIHFGLLEIDGERLYMGVVRDITDRQHAIDVFLRSEARFEATFEQAAVGIAMLAIDGSWLRVNDRLCEMLGYRHAEMLQRSFQEVTHPEDLDKDLEYLRRLLARDIATYTLEKRYVCKNGNVTWVKLTRSLVWTPDGKPDYFIAIVEDIQARKLAEASALRSTEYFRKVFEKAGNGIAVTDGAGRFQQSNRAFNALLGYSEQELARVNFAALVHPDDREAEMAQLRRLKSGEIPSFEIENRYIAKQGHAVWVRKFISILPDHPGKPAYLLALVTELSRAESTRSQSQQAKLGANAAKSALVCDYILANIERQVSLSELEHFSGLSRRSLQYAFQREFNCTPMQWLRMRRLEKARRLLEEPRPGMTVTHVALECGFSRLGAFSKDYAARFGELPSSTLKRSLAK